MDRKGLKFRVEGRNAATSQDNRRTAKFIRVVHTHPQVWKRNKNCNARSLAWRRISRQVGRAVEECMVEWRNIRSQRNYRTSTPKSGCSFNVEEPFSLPDGIDEEDSNSEVEVEFAFPDIPTTDGSSSLATAASIDETTDEEETTDGEQIVDGQETTAGDGTTARDEATAGGESTAGDDTTEQSSNSTYSSLSSPMRKTARLIDRAAEIANQEEVTTSASEPTIINFAQEKKLKYDSMYVNLDRMLKKLSEDKVEELNIKFIQITFEELKKAKNNN